MEWPQGWKRQRCLFFRQKRMWRNNFNVAVLTSGALASVSWVSRGMRVSLAARPFFRFPCISISAIWSSAGGCRGRGIAGFLISTYWMLLYGEGNGSFESIYPRQPLDYSHFWQGQQWKPPHQGRSLCCEIPGTQTGVFSSALIVIAGASDFCIKSLLLTTLQCHLFSVRQLDWHNFITISKWPMYYLYVSPTIPNKFCNM